MSGVQCLIAVYHPLDIEAFGHQRPCGLSQGLTGGPCHRGDRLAKPIGIVGGEGRAAAAVLNEFMGPADPGDDAG